MLLRQVAEDVLRNLMKEREAARLQQLQEQEQQQQRMQLELAERERLKQQQQRHEEVKQLPQHAMQLRQPQQPRWQTREQHQHSNGDHIAAGPGSAAVQVTPSLNSPPAQTSVHACQSDEALQQQQVAQKAVQQRLQQPSVASPRAVLPPVQQTVQHAQPLMPAAPHQKLHSQVQQPQHPRAVKPYQDPSTGMQPRGFGMPETTMPYLQQQQQQLRAMQPQPLQQQQPEQPSLQTPLQHLLPKSSHPPPGSHAAVGQNMVSSQQQQASVNPLQLLQHQQQLFASHMHSSQQQPTFNQLQRQLPGVLSGPGLHQGLLAPSPAGTPPSLLGSPGVMSHLMTPVSQAVVHLQQQQQQTSAYWPPNRPGLVTSGAFAGVGQPMGPGAGSRLSLEMLAPGSRITASTAAGNQLSAVGSNMGRRGSLSTPVSAVSSGQPEADMLDDLMHPAYAMANAVLSDDEQELSESVVECKICQRATCDTCCLPCGCLLMCQGCATGWRQRGESLCPFCKSPLEDFAVV